MSGASIAAVIAAVRADAERLATADSAAARTGTDCAWSVCPVTLSALALVRDDHVAHILGQRAQWVATTTEFDMQHPHPDAGPLWAHVAAMTLRPWAHGRLIADIHLARADGTLLRHVDQDFAGIGTLPATLLAALAGRPVAAYADHPLFAGIAFDETDGGGCPRTPASTIPVDGDLPRRIHARRLEMLSSRTLGVPEPLGRREAGDAA